MCRFQHKSLDDKHISVVTKRRWREHGMGPRGPGSRDLVFVCTCCQVIRLGGWIIHERKPVAIDNAVWSTVTSLCSKWQLTISIIDYITVIWPGLRAYQGLTLFASYIILSLPKGMSNPLNAIHICYICPTINSVHTRRVSVWCLRRIWWHNSYEESIKGQWKLYIFLD